jgi:hypothetical protein
MSMSRPIRSICYDCVPNLCLLLELVAVRIQGVPGESHGAWILTVSLAHILKSLLELVARMADLLFWMLDAGCFGLALV